MEAWNMPNCNFVANRMSKLPAYAIQKMFQMSKDLERAGHHIIHLEFGEPDFGTPDFIIDAAYKAMKEGHTRYESSRGMIELRKAIAQKLSEERGIEADPKSEIIVLPGAKHAIYCSLVAMINPGEEVIINDPCFPPYEFAIHLVGGKPIRVPLREDLDYNLNPQELESYLSRKTKMILLNFPNNPTGGILKKETAEAISEIARSRNLLILSDEVYDKFVYGDEKSCSLSNFPETRERTILVDSFSKTYAMTGWRLGYAVATERIIEQVKKVHESTTTCVPPFCQIAGVEALNRGDKFIDKMIGEFKCRNRVLVDGLNKIEGVHCRTPMGAFFAYPDFSFVNADDNEFSEYLLREAGVATVPGSSFGKSGRGHLRISYANSIKNLEESLIRIKEAAEGCKKRDDKRAPIRSG